MGTQVIVSPNNPGAVPVTEQPSNGGAWSLTWTPNNLGAMPIRQVTSGGVPVRFTGDNPFDSTDPVVPIDADMALKFTSADGTLMTETIFGNAKIGGTGWTALFQKGASHPTGTPSNVHVVDDPTSPSYSTPFDIGGTSYSASESKVVRIGFTGRSGADAKWERFDAVAPGTGVGSTATVQFFFKPGKFGDTGTDSAVDVGGFENAGAGFAVADQRIVAAGADASVGEIHAHSDAGHAAAGPVLSAGTWYLVTIRLNAASDLSEVLVRVASTGEIHYAGTIAANGGAEIASMVGPGNYLIAFATGEYQYQKGWVVAWGGNATMPLGSVTIPAPTSIVAAQSDVDEVTVTWTAQGFTWLVERNKNSAGWTALSAANATKSYVDTDVSDADAVQYRISTTIGETTGTAGTSNTETLDNGAFPWAQDAFAGGSDLSDLNDRTGWESAPLDFYVRNTGVIQPAATRGRALYAGTVSANHRSEVALVIGADQLYALSIGAAVRISADRTNNYEAVVVYVGGATKIQLRKRNSGTNAQIGSNYAVTVATGDELAIEATGTGAATRLTVQHKPSGGSWTDVASSVDPGGTYIDDGNPGVACHAQFGFDANMSITDWRAFEV